MSDSASPNLDAVLAAIDGLYLNPDPSYKEQASKWLCGFQKSLYAWEISDRLLYMNRDLNSCYFGAQTIRIKIQCNFTELPAAAHEGLKSSLLEHVKKLNPDTSVPIANQLCLAVADLVCHMVQWKNAIREIIEQLRENETSCAYLIDILKFIPEEMISSTLRLGLNRRHALMIHFEESKSLVIDLLSTKIKSAPVPMLARLFNCLASWWDNTGIMTEADVPISPLLESAFYILQNPTSASEATYEATSQWILALLYQNRGYVGTQNGLLSWLQQNIYGLVKVMEDCSQSVSSTDTIEQLHTLEQFKDRCTSLAHLFAALTRTLRPSLVDQPSIPGSGNFGDLRTLDCLLAVLELPSPLGSRDLCAISFHALHSLANDAIRHRSLASNVSGELLANDQSGNAAPRPVAVLLPYFTRVVVALTRYCANTTNDLESSDELREFRDDVHDLMQDILGLVGADSIFVELYKHIQVLQSLAVTANATVTASEVLREAEACLFMMTTVAKRLSPHDPEGNIESLICGLVLPGLSGQCPYPLQEVGCMLYTELAHWAACHPVPRRQIVAQLIGIVEKAARLEAIQLQPGQKVAVGTALSALGYMCSVYRASSSTVGMNGMNSSLNEQATRTGLLDEHWDELVQRVTYNLPHLAWVPVFDANEFFTGVGRGLLSSVGLGGGGVDSDPCAARQAFPSRLAQICSVSLECLNKLMNENIPCAGTDTPTDPRVWLDYLAALFRSLGSLLRRLDDGSNKPNWRGTGSTNAEGLTHSAQKCLNDSLQLVRQGIWPVLARVLTHYANRGRVMEHTCRLIRFIVRCFSLNIQDILPEIAEKIVFAYTTGGQHSSFLYLASVLVDEFGEQSNCRLGLVRVFEAVGGPTVRLLEGPGLEQQPHTVEDLYRLCTRLVQHCPAVFLTSEQVDLHQVCDTALRSLNICCTGPSAGHSADDNAANPTSPDGDSTTSVATSSASAAAARFFIDLLLFTAEAAEVTPTQVAEILSAGGQLPNPSCPSAVGAQRVLIWLMHTTPSDTLQATECGGQRLVSSTLQACCLSWSEERFPDLADILYHLKFMTKTEIFTMWLENAVNNLPILRADGLIHATFGQITDFKDTVMKATRSSGIVHALTSFSSLFR